MGIRGLVAAACLVVGCSACSGADPEPVASPSPTAPPPSSPAIDQPTPDPATRTLELRYRVAPRSDKLLRINLPPQPEGGTLITWSTYFQGIGTVASPAAPVKAECYVVQARGRSFGSRVLYTADDSSVSTGFDISLSGSGLVDTADGKRLTFECEVDENSSAPLPGLRWQTHPLQPIQVTLTPVEHERRENRIG